MMYRRGAGSSAIDVDVHLPSADEAVLLREVVVQLEVQKRLAARLEHLARLEAGFVLVAAAADRADGPAVSVDQHFGAGPLRCGPARAHDRHERDRLAALERVSRRGEDFLVQMRTSILGLLPDLLDEGLRLLLLLLLRSGTP